MQLRKNVIFQYSIVTFGVVFVISVALGLSLVRQITDYQIQSHVHLYPEIIRLSVKDHQEVYAFFRASSPRALTPELESLFRELLSLGSVFRVKVWSKDATVLWSDQKNLIGRRFPDDDNLAQALSGAVCCDIAQLDKTENVTERQKGISLEVYTPVVQNGAVIGVIEVYEANKELAAQIARTTRFAWMRSSEAGVTLYGLLFFVFARAYRRQKTTSVQLVETQDVTIFALAYQAELRDQQTGRHLERTAVYVRLLAEELVRLPEYRSYLTPSYIDDLVKSSPLHDIGKVGVPDSVLLKPGKLTGREMAQIRKHCEYGARVLLRAEQKLKFQSFLTIAIQLALHHHERWDGRGYPKRLRGDEIPLSARIMSVADSYDALRTPRVYKPAFPHDKCLSLIRKSRGTHFDPRVVDAMLARETDFRKTSEQLRD